MLLLTGPNGMLGKSLLHETAGRGIPVKAIARRHSSQKSAAVTLKVGDLGALHEWPEFMRDVTDIIHLAAARAGTKESDIYKDIPIAGRLLDHWKNGCFVYASSQIVYAADRAGDTITEDHACSPSSWYAAAKLMIEQMVKTQHALNRADGLTGRYAIFRIPVIAYAEAATNSQALDTLYYLLAAGKDFCFECSESEAAQYGSSWVGSGDLARALLDALAFRESGTYNIASGWISDVQLIEKLIRKAGSRSRLRFNAKGEVNVPLFTYRLDTKRLSETGFRSRDDLDDIVERYLRSAAGR